MAKTRSRRGARRNLTRRGGGKGSMHVEKPKAQRVKKGKSMKQVKLTNAQMKRLTKKEIKRLNKRGINRYMNLILAELNKNYREPYVRNSPEKSMNHGVAPPPVSVAPVASVAPPVSVAPSASAAPAPVAPFYPTNNKKLFNFSKLEKALEEKANNNSPPPTAMNNNMK